MSESRFRPLLSAKIDEESDLYKLTYPVLVSPKIDGIRCIIHETLGPVSRSLKPIPNEYVRQKLASLAWGWDGELVVGDPLSTSVFNMTTSGIMSYGGKPDFTYLVFDNYRYFTQNNMSFVMRLEAMQRTFNNQDWVTQLHGNGMRIRLVTHFECHTPSEVVAYEEVFIKDGYEGLMIRTPGGKYKFNRSTFKEQILIKMKRMEDDEATVIDFEELVRNRNEAVKDALGYTKRSDHQAGWESGGTLGALIVESDRWGTFNIGSGFDEALRAEIWANRDRYRGRRVSFKYQAVGVVEKPRIPVFKGFRED